MKVKHNIDTLLKSSGPSDQFHQLILFYIRQVVSKRIMMSMKQRFKLKKRSKPVVF